MSYSFLSLIEMTTNEPEASYYVKLLNIIFKFLTIVGIKQDEILQHSKHSFGKHACRKPRVWLVHVWSMYKDDMKYVRRNMYEVHVRRPRASLTEENISAFRDILEFTAFYYKLLIETKVSSCKKLWISNKLSYFASWKCLSLYRQTDSKTFEEIHWSSLESLLL